MPCKDIEVVLLGTGPSVSVPSMKCLLSDTPCVVCPGAAKGDKNCRNNPMMMLRVPKHTPAQLKEDGSVMNSATEHQNVIFDCGKTFRDTAVRLFKNLGVKYIDTVLLTHFHADAVLGLDDLRDFSRVKTLSCPKTGNPTENVTIPVYCDQHTFDKLGGVFPYLMPRKEEEGEVKRFVSALEWNIIGDYTTYTIEGVKVMTFPVEHGADCMCTAYNIESSECRLVYLSDISTLPPRAEAMLKEGRQIDVLIVDALFLERTHTTHYSLPQALDCVRLLKPKKAYFVGMSHEINYYTVNDELKRLKETEGIDVEMGFDGLTMSLPLLEEGEE